MQLIKSMTKFVTIFLLIAAGLILIVKQGWLPKELTEIVNTTFKAPPINTYYQWQDDDGNVLITKSPPPDNRFYTEFKASGEIAVTATPGKEKALARKGNALSNSQIEAFQSKKRQLMANEVGTECRWLVSEIVDLERKAKETSQTKQARACSTIRQRIEQLREQNCNNSSQEFIVAEC